LEIKKIKLFLIVQIFIGIFVKQLKIKTMRTQKHTMSFTICSKWAEIRDIAMSQGSMLFYN